MLVDVFFMWKNYANIPIIKNKLYKKGEKIWTKQLTYLKD